MGTCCLHARNCLVFAFRGVKGLFAIDWQPDGLATLQSVSNGRYVTARLNGSLQASVDQSAVGERERFTLTLANRPRLLIKCDHGFVGVKCSAQPARAECNRAFSDPVTLLPVRQMLKDASTDHTAAAYYLQGNCVPLDRGAMLTCNPGNTLRITWIAGEQGTAVQYHKRIGHMAQPLHFFTFRAYSRRCSISIWQLYMLSKYFCDYLIFLYIYIFATYFISV